MLLLLVTASTSPATADVDAEADTKSWLAEKKAVGGVRHCPARAVRLLRASSSLSVVAASVIVIMCAMGLGTGGNSSCGCCPCCCCNCWCCCGGLPLDIIMMMMIEIYERLQSGPNLEHDRYYFQRGCLVANPKALPARSNTRGRKRNWW